MCFIAHFTVTTDEDGKFTTGKIYTFNLHDIIIMYFTFCPFVCVQEKLGHLPLKIPVIVSH